MASYTVVQIRDRDDADRLVQISLDPKLSLSLQAWQSKYSESLVTVENKRSRKNSAKNEVYQLLGFYAVFQGVVLTAVTTASTLQCYNSWGPLALSALASFATLLSVHAKLKDYVKLRWKLSNAVADSQVTLQRIQMLKGGGKNFDFTELAIKAPVPAPVNSWTRKEKGYYFSVMVFLGLFSLVILASCISVACGKKLGA